MYTQKQLEEIALFVETALKSEIDYIYEEDESDLTDAAIGFDNGIELQFSSEDGEILVNKWDEDWYSTIKVFKDMDNLIDNLNFFSSYK